MGKALHELFGWPGPMTHRQFLMWQAWSFSEWNAPSRTDHYIMQLTAEVRRSWVNDASRAKIEDGQFLLRFVPKAEAKKAPTVSVEEATAWAKARWLPAVKAAGKKKRKGRRDRDGDDGN